jgi:hypothetical protein
MYQACKARNKAEIILIEQSFVNIEKCSWLRQLSPPGNHETCKLRDLERDEIESRAQSARIRSQGRPEQGQDNANILSEGHYPREKIWQARRDRWEKWQIEKKRLGTANWAQIMMAHTDISDRAAEDGPKEERSNLPDVFVRGCLFFPFFFCWIQHALVH